MGLCQGVVHTPLRSNRHLSWHCLGAATWLPLGPTTSLCIVCVCVSTQQRSQFACSCSPYDAGAFGALKHALSVRLEGCNSRKRGRPLGRRRTHTTISEHCQMYTESVSPFKRQRELSANVSDQNGSPPSPSVDHRHSLSSPFEEADVRQPDNTDELLGPLSTNFTVEADTRQLTDHTQYAGQLSNFPGTNFPPVICADYSERHTCFCLPQWNQINASLTYKPFICRYIHGYV